MSDVCCYRCRKPINGGRYEQWRTAPAFRRGGYVPLVAGMVVGTVISYHPKCLPPNIFHALAGSLPAAPDRSDASLSHDSTHRADPGSDSWGPIE